ncbi:hypothetical protein JZ751_007545, partial [Albula glossodonta]
KITKPAAKYGVPLTVRKPSDRKPQVRHKPEGARKKRMEQMEKDRKQREQVLLLKAGQMKRFEREKLNRINRAREQGWRHVLSSGGGGSPERKFFGGGGGVAVAPAPVAGLAPLSGSSKSQLEQQHPTPEHSPKLQPKEGTRASGDSPIRGVPAAAGPVLSNGPACLHDNGPAHLPDNGPTRLPVHEAVKRELRRLELVTRHANANRQRGMAAAERARQVEEFWQRKREAMLNKARAEGQLVRALLFLLPLPPKSKPNKEEEEYLARLRQIRLQNFNERQQIKARLRGEKYDSDGSDSQESSDEAQLRRKKIEALKLVSRGVKIAPSGPGPSLPDPTPRAPPSPKPVAPAISMTAALKDVGAELALAQHRVEDPGKPAGAALQSEKREILRRLNQNLKVQSEEGEEPAQPVPPPHSAPDDRPPTGGDRKRWGEAGAPPILPAAQFTLGDTATCTGVQVASPEDRPPTAERKRWEAGAPPVLSVAQQTLEETCLRTADTRVLKVLEEAELQPVTLLLKNTTVGLSGVDKTGSGTKPETSTMQPEPSPGNVLQNLQPGFVLHPGSEMQNAEPSSGSEGQKAEPGLGSEEQKAEPGLGSEERKAELGLGPEEQKAEPGLGSEGQKAEPGLGSEEQKAEPGLGSEGQKAEPGLQKDQGPLSLTSSASPPAGPLRDTEEPEDVEVEILAECPRQAPKPPAGVLQAWDSGHPNPPQQGPAECSKAPAEVSTEQESAGKSPQHSKDGGGEEVALEPLFRRLCSPARRRAVALALLGSQSSQSSQEDNASLASRSRSVSPVRQKDKDSLLIGLSTGLFDANNPKEPSEEEEEEEEDEEGGSNGSPPNEVEGPSLEPVSNGLHEEEEEEEEHHSSESDLNEEWQSVRKRRRAKLTIRTASSAAWRSFAIHEDEDETIDLGSSLVQNILGPEHQQLYPKILHLVMADGVYQEDNDEEE